MSGNEIGAPAADGGTASPVLRTEPQERLGPDGRVPTGATPGPWKARRAKHPDNTGGYDYAIAAGGKIIAEAFEHVGFVAGTPVYDARPVKANAHLIAAAPDMLRLIEDIEESLTADDTYRLLREACREIIAKARGETA